MPTCRLEVIAQGDAMQMGMQQGAALRDKIRSSPDVLEQLYGFRVMQPAWMPYSIYRRLAEGKARRSLESALQRDSPDAYLRLKGISDGAGVSLSLLHLLHAMEPMMSDVRRNSAIPTFGACSAVAVRGSRSSTGEPMIARNFDYLSVVQPLYALRESRPEKRLRSLDFTIAPFAGAVDGVNEKGLCITYDYAYANDFSGVATAPISVIISEALERCSTVVEAVKWIESRPRWGGGILMLADPGGDIASLELSNTKSHVRRPAGNDDVLFHTNKFLSKEMKSVEIAEDARFTELAPPLLRGRRVHESANARDQRLTQLLHGKEPLSPDSLRRIMADHETGGGPPEIGICRHSEYWNTTATLQLCATSRRMRVSFDWPCRAAYSEFGL